MTTERRIERFADTMKAVALALRDVLEADDERTRLMIESQSQMIGGTRATLDGVRETLTEGNP